jgi:hypothetical protein
MLLIQTALPTQKHLKVGLVGEPKYGKTRLATSLPWETFGDKAVYIAWDPGSESLDSVLVENREHLVVVQPSAKTLGNKLVFDPHKEAIAIATKPWAEGFEEGGAVIPPCQTLIWDTMTSTARDLLAAYADSGVFSGEKGDKHVSVGEFGTAYYMAQPMMGDYGIAQRAVLHILKFLLKQPLNVIVLFHTDYMEPEGAGQVTFGPATIGKAAIKPVASLFDNLFVLDVQDKLVKASAGGPPTRMTKRQVYTDKKGLYLGGLRSSYPRNPIPEVELSDNPVAFWNLVNSVRKGEYK